MMSPLPPKRLARPTLVVLAALAGLAIVSFAAVSRLVVRLKANEKRIAWRAYEAGITQVQSGHPENALDDFRAALSYDRDNSDYQLSLARALRETGRLDESQAYLLHLWNASPQDSTINLALARLAARRHSIDDALRYYHSAIYGFWSTAPDQSRRRTRFELIEFLLQQNAYSQAQAELVALAQVLPPEPAQHRTIGALAQYESALKLDPKNVAALAGAGNVAFQMGRYRTAQSFLQRTLEADPQNPPARQQLQTATLVLASDPFLRRISDAERNRRVTAAFSHAGDRIRSCAETRHVDLSGARGPADSAANVSGVDLSSLWARLQSVRPQLHRLNSPSNVDTPDTLMDLVFEIEQQTEQQCGEPTGPDLALLLISRDRETADR
jgi:tetratricopeptide (TPR) repeat protein